MDGYVYKLISKNFKEMRLLPCEELKKYSRIGCGGKAKALAFPKNGKMLCELVSFLEKHKIRYYIIGRGSNVLFADGNLNEIIIKTDDICKVERRGNIVTAECGVSLPKLALQECRRGMSGLEFACGIPSSVGGAIYMNCGAFGKSISDVVKAVYYIEDDIIKKTENNKDMFSYRESFFHRENKIVLAAEIELKRDNKNIIKAKVDYNTAKRKSTQPVGKTLGSTFKNPEGYSAGALIESCGLKGFSIGGAVVSEKHANFIINKGNATSSDVKMLVEYIKKSVYENSGLLLEEEIRFLGDF